MIYLGARGNPIQQNSYFAGQITEYVLAESVLTEQDWFDFYERSQNILSELPCGKEISCSQELQCSEAVINTKRKYNGV
jgi:hypothetical protein